MQIFLLLGLFFFGDHSVAQVCDKDTSVKFAGSVQANFMNDQLAKAKKECEGKLFKEGSPRASQHACACKNYTGNLTDHDIFKAKYATQISKIKEQYQKQTLKDPAKEKKLEDDLYANYLKAKDNLPCGNNVSINADQTVSVISDHMGFYCANDKASAALLQVPLCNDKAAAATSKKVLEKSTADMYQEKFSDPEKSLSKQFVCQPKPRDDGREHTLLSQETPPCALSFLKKFQDNGTSYQSGVTNTSVMDEIKKSDCYQKIKRDGLEVDHIDIESSSSLLANTGSASNKTFKQLSDDRAIQIRDNVFKKIPGLESSNYRQNTAGKNGDGTSGPCPYQFTQSEPFWSRRDEIKDEMLEDSKYVRAKIFYKNKSTPLSGTGHQVEIYCSVVTFGCSPGKGFTSGGFK